MQTPLDDRFVYDAIGDAGFARLVQAFYIRVRSDDLIGPMYPSEDLHGAEERLREFLIQRFGGPEQYSKKRGHPRLRMRHGPFQIDQAARDRWVSLMESALAEMNFEARTAEALRSFFHDGATFMINQPGS